MKHSLPISWYLLFLTKRPLHLVFIKATTIVLDTISSLHMVWVSQINICVVTERMRDKTTGKVNKWPITKATLRFSLEKFAGSSCKPKTMWGTHLKISVCTLLNVENISSRRNSFGLGPNFCQQNEHMSIKKMKRTDYVQGCQLFLEYGAC